VIIKCPYCGFEGDASEFNYLYEVTLYIMDSHVEREERERSVLIVCPKCKQGFFLENPYKRFYEYLDYNGSRYSVIRG
jgi:DNA-directed RNA polymerase subunit RPC12/RpoP